MRYRTVANFYLLLFILLTCRAGSYAQGPGYHSAILDKVKEGAICMDIDPSGRYILFGSGENIAKVWDTEEDKITWEEELPREIYSVKYLPNGRFFTVNGGKIIFIYNSKGKYINKFTGHSTAIWSMDTDPKGEYLVSGSFEKYIRIWNIPEVRSEEKKEAHKKSVLAVCFNTGGDRIATGSLDESIKIWSWPSLSMEHSFFAHAENIYDLEFSPGGDVLASASRDEKIKLWDVDSGRFIRLMKGHKGSVFTLSFSPDGNFLISGASSGNIRLWEVSTGECIYTYSGHTGGVTGVHFFPDGKRFASSSQDGSIRIWNLSPELITDHCCKLEIESELKDKALFLPRKEDESKKDHKIRLQKQEEVKLELINKYYKAYIDSLNN